MESNLVYLTKRYFFDINLMSSKPVILTVGAFKPKLVAKLVEMFPKCKIILYEADPFIFNHITSMSLPVNMKVINEAITDENKEVTIYRYKQTCDNSLYPLHEYLGKRLVDKNIVTGKTLATVLDEHNIKKLDYLLLNCEGCELAILRHIVENKKLTGKVVQICTSFHCTHCRIYPVEERDKILESLEKTHDIILGKDDKVRHYLFVHGEADVV